MSNYHAPYPYHPYQQPPGQPAGPGATGPYPSSGGQHAGMTPAAVYGGAGYGYAQLPFPPGMPPPGTYPARAAAPFFNFSNDRFVKGLLIGAAATYLVTNEGVQRAVIKGAVRTWSMLQGGVEEIKERFQDAEAELHHDAERRAASD